MHIPDPVELMEAREERLAWEWDQAQKGVPEGSYKCPNCGNIFSYEPIQVCSRPDSPVSCFECLPEDAKKYYEEFERQLDERNHS